MQKNDKLNKRKNRKTNDEIAIHFMELTNLLFFTEVEILAILIDVLVLSGTVDTVDTVDTQFHFIIYLYLL